MTKKIFLLTSAILLVFAVFAQKSNVGKAVVLLEEGEYNEAYATIQKSLDPENPKASKTIEWPRAWIVRGEILMEIGRIGIRNIVSEPLLEAHASFMNAIKYDKKGRQAYDLIPKLDELQKQLSRYGKQAYQQRKFDVASQCFLTYMEIEFHPFLSQYVDENLDTVITYNAGLAAYEGKKWKFTIDYFGLAEKQGCVTPVGKYCIANAYKALGDTTTCIEILKTSNSMYPDNEKISGELINLYLSINDNQNALAQINESLINKPKDIVMLMRKGRLLEKMNKGNEAVKVYLSAIQIDPLEFTPYYNLGVKYFNEGASIINEAISLPENEDEKFIELTKKGNQHLEMCLPYFEKAYEIKPTENSILKSLSYIYKQLEMTEKHEEAERKLKI